MVLSALELDGTDGIGERGWPDDEMGEDRHSNAPVTTCYERNRTQQVSSPNHI